MVALRDKLDAKRAIEDHVDEIDRELNKRVDGQVRAELLKAKSKALELAVMLIK
jgi:hypothetical protein